MPRKSMINVDRGGDLDKMIDDFKGRLDRNANSQVTIRTLLHYLLYYHGLKGCIILNQAYKNVK